MKTPAFSPFCLLSMNDDAALNAALATYLGDARLKDAITDVLITAYDFGGRFAFLFRSSRARRYSAQPPS